MKGAYFDQSSKILITFLISGQMLSRIIGCRGGPCLCLLAGDLEKALTAIFIRLFMQIEMMKWNFFSKNMSSPCKTQAVNMIQVMENFPQTDFKFFFLVPGHHSFDTSSAVSSEKITNKENKIHKHKTKQKKRESRSQQLVTIVSINGEVTTVRTVCKKLPEKQVKISRSKTLPSSLYKNSLKVTVNGAGCFDFKEEF